jgi:beta-hydroxylase
VTPQRVQALRTEGLQDTMNRPGLLNRLLMGAVGWAERLNLRYARLGNPPVYDNAAFPWAAEVERDWRSIRAELDSVLIRRDELPGFHEIARRRALHQHGPRLEDLSDLRLWA